MNLIESMSADVDCISKSVLLLPVGSLEQHGTQAPLGCDGIIASELCLAAAKITGCAVLPGLFYGCSNCHKAFPGTFSLSRATYQSLLSDIISEADRNLFRNLFIISGHGGNRAGAESAISDTNLSINVQYFGYWEIPGFSNKEETLFGKTGYHITTSEVSMVWYLLKRAIPEDYTGKYPDPVENISSLTQEEWRSYYPEGGVGGDMSRVSVEQGEILFDFVSDRLAKLINAKE